MKSRGSPNLMAFSPLRMTPKLIWSTPIMTAYFILRLLKKDNSLLAINHLGSIPKGQVQLGNLSATSPAFSQQLPNRFQGKARNSLQINPLQVPKNPIIVNRYLISTKGFREESGYSLILSALQIRYSPNSNNRPPWPISPNMTPNRKGKKAIANNPGLISPYLGIP